EEPVVPRPRRGQTQLGIRGLREHPAAEAGDHRREVERGPHAVDVHVADAGLEVVTTRAHLLEPERFDLHRLGPAPGDRVLTDLVVTLTLELPDLVALVGLDDPR